MNKTTHDKLSEEIIQQYIKEIEAKEKLIREIRNRNVYSGTLITQTDPRFIHKKKVIVKKR